MSSLLNTDLPQRVRDLESLCATLAARIETPPSESLPSRCALERRSVRKSAAELLSPESEERSKFEAALALEAKPGVADSSWDRSRRGTRAFLMITADQSVDRRILQEARTLLERGWAGRIVCLSQNYEDALEECEGVGLHRVGLDRVIPDCPAYWRYRWGEYRTASCKRRTDPQSCAPAHWGGRRVAFREKWRRILSRLNPILYLWALRFRYGRTWAAHPLPHTRAFYEAGRFYPADVVFAHDLPALPGTARLAEEWNAPLIYDSHELFCEQGIFTRKQRRIMRRVERSLIRKCDAVLTVNDSIADELAARYGCPRPCVLTNAVDPPPDFSPDRREDHLRRHFALSPDTRIVLYQGGLVGNRNIENLVSAMRFVNEGRAALVVMGDGPLGAGLADIVDRECLRSRVFFKSAVPQEDLVSWTASADFGVIPYPPVDLNTRYCTPNKLFEYIQACLPILANDLPELRRYVAETGFGATAPMRSPEEIARTLNAWLANPEAIERARKTLVAKRDAFSWKAASEKLLECVSDVWERRKPNAGAIRAPSAEWEAERAPEAGSFLLQRHVEDLGRTVEARKGQRPSETRPEDWDVSASGLRIALRELGKTLEAEHRSGVLSDESWDELRRKVAGLTSRAEGLRQRLNARGDLPQVPPLDGKRGQGT